MAKKKNVNPHARKARKAGILVSNSVLPMNNGVPPRPITHHDYQ